MNVLSFLQRFVQPVNFWRVASALLPVGGQQAAPGEGRHQADFPIFSGQLDIFNFEIELCRYPLRKFFCSKFQFL